MEKERMLAFLNRNWKGSKYDKGHNMLISVDGMDYHMNGETIGVTCTIATSDTNVPITNNLARMVIYCEVNRAAFSSFPAVEWR